MQIRKCINYANYSNCVKNANLRKRCKFRKLCKLLWINKSNSCLGCSQPGGVSPSPGCCPKHTTASCGAQPELPDLTCRSGQCFWCRSSRCPPTKTQHFKQGNLRFWKQHDDQLLEILLPAFVRGLHVLEEDEPPALLVGAKKPGRAFAWMAGCCFHT